MSIILTTQQAAALASLANAHPGDLQLHQVGEDPDLFITTSGEKEPDFLIRPDGAELSLRTAGAARHEP